MSLRACGFIVFRRLVGCNPPPGNIEYLLLQTSYGEHHWTPPKGLQQTQSLIWENNITVFVFIFKYHITCLLSGHVDPGEDDLTTALRETKEEAGLGPEQLQIIDGFVQELRYEVRGRPKEVLYWLAELKNPETAVTLSNEHQDYRWAQLEEACKLTGYKDLQETLRAAHRHLEAQQH